MPDNLVTIDGSLGEGGGQVLRTSLGLAAALWGHRSGVHKRLRIKNIRANRPKPGLRPQHLAAVKAAAAVTDGSVEGAQIGSASLTFIPRAPKAGRYRFDIGTAGSAMLVLQTIVPALLAAEGNSEVVISGGTHNPMAPCFEYVRDVVATLAEAANASMALTLMRAGFYPAGGGKIRCRIRGLGGPDFLTPLRLLSRGDLCRVEGISAATRSLPQDIIDRQARQVIARLGDASLPGSIERVRMAASSPGTVVFLRAVFSRSVAGFYALGRKGKPAEKVADDAADDLVGFLNAPGAVDPHAADQLITLLALAPARSELTTTRLTQHLLTNAEVIRQVSERTVHVEGEIDAPGRVIIA